MTSRLPLALLLAIAAPSAADDAGAADPGPAEDGVLLRAMRDELARNMAQLEVRQLDKPYFLSYRVEEGEAVVASASFGALLQRNRRRDRTLTVELRVGSPEFDNTNFLPTRTWSSPQTRTFPLPLVDDYRELRRSLWLATDTVYKHALDTLAKKRGALENQTREAVPDFSAAEPYVDLGSAERQALPEEALARTVRSISAVFREFPQISASQVHAFASSRLVTYLSSEGTAFAEVQPSAGIHVLAGTQAADGTVLQDFRGLHAHRWRELPPAAEVRTRVRALGAALTRRRSAKTLERYNGPVLFEGQAAAELIAQALVPRLLATRVPVAEEASAASYAASLGNPFVDRIGARVLPRFLTVVDDPAARGNAAGALYGGYRADSQGVPAAPTTVIRAGVLETLLSSRSPVAGIARSSGNLRGNFLLPSNLLVTPSRGLPPKALREELLVRAAERGNDHGIVVRRLGASHGKLMPDGSARSAAGEVAVERITEAVEIHADGREEPIRKAILAGLGIAAFRDIVAVSEAVTNHALQFVPPNAYALRATTALYGISAATGTISIATPDLLFEELSIKRPAGHRPRPPIAAHPFFAEGAAEAAR